MNPEEPSPITRYHNGDRDPEARKAKSEEWRRYVQRPGVRDARDERRRASRETTREYHRKIRQQPVGDDRDMRMNAFVEAIRDGATYQQALTETGLTANAINGRRRIDPDFTERLDTALMDGRGPTAGPYDHGTLPGYTHGKCRCPECRDARDQYRNR